MLFGLIPVYFFIISRMKNLYMSIIAIISIFLFSNCTSQRVNLLLNDKKQDTDIQLGIDYGYCCGIDCGLYTGDDVYKHERDSSDTRLKYQFKIISPNLPIVKLNSLSIHDKQGNKIQYNLYSRFRYDPIIDAKELPLVIDKYANEKGTIIIVAECSQTYKETEEVYFSYNIEVGNDTIIKESIRYKRYSIYDGRPKFW